MERSLSSPRRQRRWPALLLASFTAGATMIGGTITAGAVQAPALTRTAAAAAPYKIVLSNNFLGNDWRPEMERASRPLPRTSRRSRVKSTSRSRTRGARRRTRSPH